MLILGIVSLGLFALFGGDFESFFNFAKFSQKKNSSTLSFLAVLALIGDIILPLPATGIMAGLGKLQGFWLGSLLSFIGTFSAGLIGYGVARFASKKWANKISSVKEQEEYQHIFDKYGAFAIILSRAMPILPEVMTILAGFSKMEFRKFITALFLGSVPTALFFSWLGSNDKLDSSLNILVSVLLPVGIFTVVNRLWLKKQQKDR